MWFKTQTQKSNKSSEFKMHITTPVQSSFFNPSTEQGKVEVFWYNSKDYTGLKNAYKSINLAEPFKEDYLSAVKILKNTHKPAYIYLPFGYNTKKKYDIIYLLHGWTMTAEDFFGLSNIQYMKNMFDNMIEKGLVKPFIAVSPTWDKDNKPKGWGESTDEVAVFAHEYVLDLIPSVESHYSAFCTSTDIPEILASRSHRAIGGFSLGSIATWYLFEYAFPFSRWYLPMSGDNWHCGMFGGQYYPSETAKFLANLVNNSKYGKDFYVYYAVGTNDSRIPQTHNQALAMAELSDTFNENNFSYNQKQKGLHDLNSVYEFIYNALPFFFPPISI